MSMPTCEPICHLDPAMAKLQEKAENLEERLDTHERKQNGSLQRIEEKLDRFTWWLVLTLGGVAAATILLLANLIFGR